MSLELAQRINRIKPSPTIAVTNRANELKQQGLNILSLGAGEPDFDTPNFIKEAAIEAINNGQTKYTAVDGTSELKTAIKNKFINENNLSYTLEEILVSCGAKQSIYNLVTVLLQKGDEAIIPCPYWVSYPSMVELADATPVYITTDKEKSFKISAQDLEQSITEKTRLLFLNSPSNPSGQIYTKQELLSLVQVLLKYPNVYIISDDIYEHIIFDNLEFHNILTACADEISQQDYQNLRDRTLVVNGVSKAYAMTGWRIGYAAGHKDIIKGMKKLQSQSTSNPCSISQAASTVALNSPLAKTAIADMVIEFKKRHDYVHEAINSIDGLSCIMAQGAFYSFIDFSSAIKDKGLKDDSELAIKLLENNHVALVAGSAFGLPNYLRLSYATSMQNLQEAVTRIKSFLAS